MIAVPKREKGNQKGGMSSVELRKRIDSAFQWTTTERRLALLTVAFAEGDQWKSADPNGVRLLDVVPPRGRDVERVTRNVFGPALRHAAARLSRPLQFEVMARGADDVSRESAELATIVINDTAVEHEFDELNRVFMWDLLTGGTAALILEWDPDGGGAGVDPLTGEEFGTGDIVVSTADIGQFAVQPGSRGVKAHWFVWARTMDPLDAQEVYGLAEPPKGDTSIGGLSFGARRGVSQDGHCTVYTYFERPHGKLKGGIWTLIGNEIVEHTEWWYPFDDRLPLSIGRDTVQPRRWQGYATAWDGLDPQVELNETLTAIREAVTRFGDPKLIAPPTFEQDQLEESADVIMADAVSEPKWLEPLRISSELHAYAASAVEAVEDALGQAAITKGKNPPGVSSGTAFAALIDQANEFLVPYSQEIARCWSDMGSMILQVLEDKVRDPEVRTAKVREYSTFTTEVRWNGDMLNGHTSAVVPSQAVRPRNFAAALVTADNLKEKFADQIDLRTYTLVGELQTADVLDAVEPDYACAMEENHRMWAGRPCEPEEIDDHEVHMNVVTTFM